MNRHKWNISTKMGRYAYYAEERPQCKKAGLPPLRRKAGLIQAFRLRSRVPGGRGHTEEEPAFYSAVHGRMIEHR
jgi:hypothetical protein